MSKRLNKKRRGAIAVLMALLLIPMLAMVALCVDYGYLLVVRTDLQRTADAAVLAAVRDLIPSPGGTQDINKVRATVRQYVTTNVPGGLTVLDSDIQIGRYDPATIYSGVTILSSGVFDTVRVTLRRDYTANSPVSLFFARIIGITQAAVSVQSTAVLQKAAGLPPGADILPMAIPEATWNAQSPGDTWSIYGDGKVMDKFGNVVPGNWGTLDIGPDSNSTNDLDSQINYGLAQSDLNSLYSDGRIASSTQIGGTEQFWATADTGYSAGLKASVQANHGKTKLVPIVNDNSGASGNNLQFHVVGWGVVQLIDSNWNGNPSKRNVQVMKAYMYDGDLSPHSNLGATTGFIPAAYTSPALVE